MRKLLFALPMLALCGCSMQQIEESYKQSAPVDAQRVLRISTIVCADGNQIRMVVYALGGNATSFTGWTILNDDGTPKKCVKRAKAIQPQYEEVPQ